MPDPSLARLEALFEQAVALPPHARPDFLDASCYGEPELRRAVEELLQNDATLGPDDGYLRGPILTARSTDAPPICIAGYRVLRKIGDGGMGAVYEAEQENPLRRVAVKVIRPGMASQEVLRRFQLEAHVLGRLHHPGIAQIHQAGVTVDGQPFIAMEYVCGATLREYVREHSLTIDARIDLVVRVCDAVQHAHEQGVIHRDLKPGNILVDESGSPRVLDFGVARATGLDLPATPTHTQAGQLLGTPAYMSPEQIAADPAAIDHRTDVYSLGVILFELLADRLPFDLLGVPLPEVARVICEREAPALGSVNRMFRGDLETIVAKTLEKEPKNRYVSAMQLADDLRRYRYGKPILARPISSAERLWRWSQLNRGLAASLAIIALLVVATAIGSTVAAFRFQDIAQENQQAREKAEQAGKGERWERYRANIAAASALQMQDTGAARSALAAAPEEHRNWEWRHFHGQLDSSHLVLGTSAQMNLVVVSPDGKRAATAKDFSPGEQVSPLVIVWDLVTGTPLQTLTGGDGAIVRSVSPDCRLAAFGTDEGTVRVTDLTTGREIRSLKTHAGKVTALAFRPDGNCLYTAGEDRTIRLWDLGTGKNTVLLRDLNGAATHVGPSPDGTRLFVGTDTVRLWDIERRKVIAESGMGVWRHWPLRFSTDGRRAAIGGDYPHNNVQVLDAATGERVADLRGHQNSVFQVAFSPDGSRIASASHDQTIRLWDGRSDRPIAVLHGHTSPVLDIAFSPDSKRLVSAGDEGTLRVWDTAGGASIDLLRGHAGRVESVAWSTTGEKLASVSSDRTLRVWDAPAAGRGVLAGHTNFVYDVACNPDGSQLASAAWDGTVRLWDQVSGKQTAMLKHGNEMVTGVTFSPNGNQLASVTRDNRVTLWDLDLAKPRHIFTAPTGDSRAAFHPNGTQLALGSLDGHIRLWDTTTGQSAGTFAAGPKVLHDLAFNPDGTHVACAGNDGTIPIWDVGRRERVVLLRGHTSHINRIVYSKDGKRLVSAGDDRTVRVWNSATGEELLPPLVHASVVWSVALSPDETRLATACGDNTIRLWDLATGQEVAELRGHRSYVKSVAFSPDGTQLFSASGDFTVRIWDSVSSRVRAKFSVGRGDR